MAKSVDFELYKAFTLKAEGLIDRIVTQALVAEAFDPSDGEEHRHEQIDALWDTGATNSAITKELANALGLIPAGKTDVLHAGGSSDQVNTYLVNVFLPNEVGVQGVFVHEANLGPIGVDMLIGMDIIVLGDFALTNTNGKTVVSFRIPSYRSIDYVAEHYTYLKSVINRNDLCPCGSGKKFKKCHGLAL